MRLLIYLLAMMTGFSAAEAARPMSATPATLGSAMSSAASVAASVALVQRRDMSPSAFVRMSKAAPSRTISPRTFDAKIFIAPTPVMAHDVSLQ